MGILQRLGAAALGAPFVWLGYEAAARPGGRILLAERLGVPRPEAAVRLNGMAMVAGGLGLITGVLPRAAAAGLVASLVPTTLAGHAFWRDDDPAVRTPNRINFLKNVGLIGGLVLIAARDPRPPS